MAPPSPYPGTLKAESFANWQPGILLFIVAFLGFWLSPIPQVQDTDAKYALLVSHRLLTSGQMNLDPFFPEAAGQKDDWRIERAGSHLYYFFPPGTSFLSLPFVAVGKLLGRSIVSPEEKYLFQVEQQLQTAIAAVLMAFLVAIFFLTARLVLPLSWSCIVALGAGFGTQVWSTMSRGLWSDTWGALLIGVALLILVAQEVHGRRMNPVLLGTLLAWSYIVRPTYSIHIAAITVYVWLFHRRLIIRLVLTGACWLIVFVTYSWIHFHTFLPSYYSPGRIKFDGFGVTLAGNLISPSRGLLCHVPAVLLVAGLVIYYWRELRWQRLVGLAGIVVAGHLIVHSSPQGSLGGGCFGARYTSGLVPWFVLCAVLALDAMRRSSSRLPRLALATCAFLLALGVGINGRGAMARETWMWNSDFDLHPWKMWDWKHPQFLAGLNRHRFPQPFSRPRDESILRAVRSKSFFGSVGAGQSKPSAG
ncbi:MAG: hypothetical protein IAF94_05680, partial [Pirellulaceae bacterium]|nr:hypothetical protein [Pirellulaceae bacterium]